MSAEDKAEQGARTLPLVLGTRGSELALAQARIAEAALREKCGLRVQIEIIRTSGDESREPNMLGRKGIFTAELERALLEKRIDVAVHSAKDLPSEMLDALTIAVALPRGAAEDVLVTRRPAVLSFATIATGSVRRQRQVRWLKNPQQLDDLRGNVPTRLRKFANSDWDAVILARAGLERLGLCPPQFEFEKQKFFAQIMPIEQFVPAGGQGIIALQMRTRDAARIWAADDCETHLCLRAEREFLRLLQGDCNLPVGAHARVLGSEMELRVQLFEENEAPIMASARGDDPEELAGRVFEKIEHERK